MDFFGVGFWELVMIAVLAAIFIGPRDMPKVARKIAHYVRQIRLLSQGLLAEWNREVNEVIQMDDFRQIKTEIDETRQALRHVQNPIKESISQSIAPHVNGDTPKQKQP